MGTSIPLPGVLLEGSGVKHEVSTALGITDTKSGGSFALSTVFSLLFHTSYVPQFPYP